MKKFILIMALCIMGCHNKPGSTITISIDHNRQTVKIIGLSEVALNGIKRDSLSLEAWQTLFPLTAMPADTDVRNLQQPMKGKYLVTDQAITFKPDSLFKSGQTYFARFYRYNQQISVLDLAAHKRTPGKASYTELIFKY